MTAFNPKAPAWQRKKLARIAELAAETNLFLDGLSCLDLSEVVTSNIEWQDYAGYWSRNSGGFLVETQQYNAVGSGSYITRGQRAEKERLQAQLLDDFMDAHPDADKNDYYNHPAFEQYEQEFYEDGSDTDLMQFRCWVDDKQNIVLDLTIFYKDAPYYRASTGELIAELVLAPEQFARITLETVENYFRRAVRRA